MLKVNKIAVFAMLGAGFFSCKQEDVTPDLKPVAPVVNTLKSASSADGCLIGDVNGDGKDDILKTTGNGWYVSHGAIGSWTKICTSQTLKKQLLMADINGDGKSDMLFPNPNGHEGAGWYVAYSCKESSWVKVLSDTITSSVTTVNDCLIGDVNGDGKDDIIRTTGAGWYVSYSATGSWVKVSTSGTRKAKLLVGDINRDGKCDMIFPNTNGHLGAYWYVSYGCNSGRWDRINRNPVSNTYEAVANCFVGDINGDKRDDIVKTTGDGWFVSYSGTGSWSEICTSKTFKNQLLMADIKGDGKIDMLFPNVNGHAGAAWYVAYDCKESSWLKVNSEL